MKPYCMQVFAVSILMLFVQSVSSNQKDDLILVEKLIELYPDIDLTKEAILQTELIAQKYNKDLAAILDGKIRYKINQKSLARKSFTQVKKDSEFFKDSIFTYYKSAVDEAVKDASGIKESSGLFVDNKLWGGVEDRNSDDWELVKQIFKSYSELNRNDRAKMAQLKKVLSELNIVLNTEGEINILISENEKVFLNNWDLVEGDIQNKKSLENALAVLRDLEFGEKGYEYFVAFPNRARILTMLGKSEMSLKLLGKTKEKIVEYDAFLKKHLDSSKDMNEEQKKQAFSHMSVLSIWYYAKAVALFQKFRAEFKVSKEKAGEALFGKHGTAVNFYLCVKKFPENNYSYKSILAYQKLRELISVQYSKKMKELSVPNLIQGKAFYIVEDYENALKYLSQAVMDPNKETAYDAYNLAVGASVKLSKHDDVQKYFKEMSEKFSKLNTAPNDHITKLTNYCVATYLKLAREVENPVEKKAFYNKSLAIYKYAQENGKRKSNITVKYLFLSRALSDLVKLKKEDVSAGLAELKPIIKSLLVDHKLSKESVKVSKTLAQVYQKSGKTAEAIEQIELYLSRMKTFSAKLDEEQVKMKMLLVELLISEGDLKKAKTYLEELPKSNEKFAEGLSSINVRFLHSTMSENETDSLRAAYIETAEKHISEYRNSKARPYIIAQLAVTYQNNKKSEKANQLYAILQKEYPDHAVNQGTGFNQVLAVLKEENGTKALSILSHYEELPKMKAKNLYAVTVQIANTFDDIEIPQEAAAQFLRVLSFLDGDKGLNGHALQRLALIKSEVLIVLGKLLQAEKILSESIERFPQGSYVIKSKLMLASCYSKQQKFGEVSKLYSSLQSMVSRLKGGAGDSSLSVKVAAVCSGLFSQANEEKYLKKGKYIAFLASQYNPSSLHKSDLGNLEEVVFWNTWYSKKLNNSDFIELKKDFLKKYPSSKYASELRKL